MNTTQLNIFGKPQDKIVPTTPTTATNRKKFYPVVALVSGLNELEMQNDFMLIHRILQRRLRNDINRNIRKLIQVSYNEMLIKSGRMSIATATRTSLLMCLL